jgi:hypothetical protein
MSVVLDLYEVVEELGVGGMGSCTRCGTARRRQSTYAR